MALSTSAQPAVASDTLQMAIVASDTGLQTSDGTIVTLRSGSLVSVIESSGERHRIITEQIHLLEKLDIADESIEGWVAAAKLMSPGDALRTANQVAMDAPGVGFALLARANANLALQQPEKSIADLDRAVDLNDGNLVLYVLRRAEILRRLGRYADSISDSTIALKKSPDLVSAYLVRARAKCDTGRFQDAIADCDHALTLNPKSFTAMNYRAYTHMVSDDIAKGLRDLKESHRLQGRLPLIAQKVNAALVAAWDASRGIVEDWPAMRRFQLVARSLPGITELIVLYGVRAEQSEEPEIALVYLSNVLTLPLPRHAELRAYYYRSRAYGMLRDHSLAQKDIASAIRIADAVPAPTSQRLTRETLLADQACWLGAELADAHEHDKALVRYEEALRWNPNSISAVSDHGFVMLQKGEFEKARCDFSKVLDSSNIGSRTRSRVLCGRASAFCSQDKLPDALTDLTSAVEIRPEFIDAWGYRAIIYAKMGEFEKANDDCVECIVLAPHSGIPYRSRAAVSLVAGKLNKSLLDYGRAIDCGLQDAATYSRRGYIRWKVGQYELALNDFERAIRLDPNCSIAHRGLGELR
ncbi:MAG TPA: tetratricopeptide repeat protein, partial [Schlesneria sp.]